MQGIKRQSGKDRETYLRNICEEIETAHMQKKIKVIHECEEDHRKTGPKSTGCQRQGWCIACKSRADRKKRWGEHFQSLYNPHTMTDSTVFDDLPIRQRCGDETATIN